MNFPSVISLDIETYGILEAYEQTVFHPVKSVHIDGIPRDQLIQTVFLTWKQPNGPDKGKFKTGGFIWSNKAHRQTLHKWFHLMRANSTTILGQNIVFDLLYLRYSDSVIRHYTDLRSPPQSSIQFDDLMIINFLDFEERPEKSLKSLVVLFGLDTYDNDVVTGSKGNATGPTDPNLLHYAAKDPLRTYELYDLIWQRISKAWPTSSKHTPLCKTLRNNLLRVGLEMSESGIHMNPAALQTLWKEKETHLASLRKQAAAHDLILDGKGSKKSKLSVVTSALTPQYIDNDAIERTKVTKEISIGKANLEFIMTHVSPDRPEYPLCELIYTATTESKMISSYLKPLLTKPTKGLISPSIPIAYPSWHLVPSSFGNKTSNDIKGTIQGRITCAKPGLQTFPPLIKDAITSRYSDGVLVTVDYKQIELVVPGLLSQDPTMLEETNNHIDRHTRSALMIADTLGVKINLQHRDFRPIWRQMGKKLNFLVIYRGGPAQYRKSLIEEAAALKNYDLLNFINDRMTIDICTKIIRQYDRRYHVFRSWQDHLISIACKTGRLELPTGWSRSFPGGSSVVMNTYVNEICNFPIQTTAAQLTLDSQYKIHSLIRQYKKPIHICSQTYDSILFDLRIAHLPWIEKTLQHHLTNPDLSSIFYSNDPTTLYGGPRRVTFEYDISIKKKWQITRKEKI